MTLPLLSVQDARHLHLAAQGVLKAPRRKATRADVLAAIQRMALLQIDTINVVERSPWLVLYSRLGAYRQAWLEECLAAGGIFEYWAHEACFVPVADYGLLRHRMLDPVSLGWKFSAHHLVQHRDDIERLIDHIRCNGPVRSADFVREGGKGTGWWDWKPEKRHLEVLFASGQLMVRERKQFQRVYDLAERVLPGWNDARDLPSPEEALRQMIKNSCRALGIVKAGWVADYYRLKRDRYQDRLEQLADEGELIPVRVEGYEAPLFVHASLADELELCRQGKLTATATTFLSPFDPVVWDRQRALELFDFDYRIECYTPAAKRRFGYFVLPILNRGKLVGRLDAKAHRAQGVFEVKALYLEPGVRCSQRLANDIAVALDGFAAWHGSPRWHVSQGPAELLALLRGARDSVYVG